MKTKIFYSALASALLVSSAALQSCSLDEENPGGFTLETLAANSTDSYETLINNCFFGVERRMYGTEYFMEYTEGDTDLWTYQANVSSSYTQWFWYFAGGAPNTTYTNDLWNSIYDGIGACNIAIANADLAPFKSDAERNKKVAIARFMRAVYYFNAVEQFGGVTMITEPAQSIDFSPTRTEPLEIYKQVIIPDLEFAAEWLEVGTDATTTTPTKKAAIGMLAKACLQTYEYGTTEYLEEALANAKTLISDCESGGGTYGAYMYSNYADIFAEANNYENKEALWKHRWYAGSDGHGSSNGNWKLNFCDQKFLCNVYQFGAVEDNQDRRLTWAGGPAGTFMPTQHLLSLFVQDDGTLDPRFHTVFTTEWYGNKDFTWDTSTLSNYDKSSSLEGQTISSGSLAVKFVVPQDDDYASEVASKSTSNYLLVDYKDVYSDANRNVNMTYNGSNNLFRYFYPSLNKHNSSNYYVANAKKKRNGNLNATFIMRMAEVYLIAAEADIYLNGGANALGYINKVRTRAGANALTGTPTVRTVLDERGRELCGEYCRFYDLKRTGMLSGTAYLQETHPDLAQYFQPAYALRPISTTYTATITNGDEYQNPGY